ncbi:MAG TPA: isocitrate lyase/PEP mutase family protein [Acidimicrobiales bacterium]|nr:isocitrate lyase/PEP mutase family protein [Acidimicrobiales bacterium]
MTTSNVLQTLLERGDLVVAPGAFDGLSARLVELAGFDAVYGSGGAIARAAGLPDIGLLGLTEVLDRMSRIVDATDLPVIADADTGFGNAINVHRTAKEFARIGVAAFHLEDQTFPKRCGHLDDKTLVPAEEMIQKIKTAKDATAGEGILVIARTDAIAVEGFSAAIERANRYGDAGADMIFVEAPETVEQIEEIAKQVSFPKLINMFYGGKTPLVPRERLRELGYQLAIIPSDLQRSAIHAMQATLRAIHDHGDSSSVAGILASFDERERIIRTEAFLDIDRKHAESS